MTTFKSKVIAFFFGFLFTSILILLLVLLSGFFYESSAAEPSTGKGRVFISELEGYWQVRAQGIVEFMVIAQKPGVLGLIRKQVPVSVHVELKINKGHAVIAYRTGDGIRKLNALSSWFTSIDQELTLSFIDDDGREWIVVIRGDKQPTIHIPGIGDNFLPMKRIENPQDLELMNLGSPIWFIKKGLGIVPRPYHVCEKFIKICFLFLFSFVL